MTTTRRLAPLVLLAVLAAACAGKDTSTPADTGTPETSGTDVSAGSDAPTETLPAVSPTTPAATTEVDSVTWALYREPNTLDPIYAFDYPENTAITAMCDSLLLQEPDGTIVPGVATLTRPDDTTMLFTLRDGVTFWDGSPLTAQDVVFSLQRQADPTLGGYYSLAFDRVSSIEATAPNEVTITLSQPDYWLEGELSSMAGIVLEQAYVESKGSDYGTPSGGVMCTGAYELSSWATGDRITVNRNEGYWNGTPLVSTIQMIGVPDEATLTSALLTGDVNGSYIGPVSGYDQLVGDDSLTVTSGPSYASAALIVSSFGGVLGDVDVRTALSKAIDRQGLIDAVYHGQAILPRAVANPGSWGYGRDVFETGWDELPEPTLDVEGGTALVEQAGATGKTLVLGTTNEIASVATTANAIKAAGEAIGLKVELQAVSAANYINYFIDPNARAGIDGFVTVNYPDYADPAALYATYALPNGTQNYSGYENADVTALLDQARTTADPDARAELVTQAQALIQADLPWIGLALPRTVLVTSSNLTGAPSSFTYMSAPWAATLGGTD